MAKARCGRILDEDIYIEEGNITTDYKRKGVRNVNTEVLENQIRGLNIVLGALQAASRGICKNCIGLEGAKTKVGKMAKKLGIDLDAASISCEKTKGDLQTRIDSLSKSTEELEVAEGCECQKTTGNCKMGAACLVNSAVDLMKLVQ